MEIWYVIIGAVALATPAAWLGSKVRDALSNRYPGYRKFDEALNESYQA